MHDVRFRQMESGLPEEFRDEDEMKRQRKIHDQLITKGLEIITDSYIDVLEPLCEKYDVELVRRSLEGKNFKVIVEDVNSGDRKSTRLNPSHANISYAVFCLKKKIYNTLIHS